jgi:hypothetical protein
MVILGTFEEILIRLATKMGVSLGGKFWGTFLPFNQELILEKKITDCQ